MDRLTQAVVDQLLGLGADLVGIAPAERFENAPEGHRPTDFMPECKSVISVALHLFDGMADVWGEYAEPGKTPSPYLFYGYGLTNLESSRIVNRVAKLLEYQGHKTLCFLPTWTVSSYKYFEESDRTGKLRAEFSHRHAAVATGVADFGWSGLALTPEFGPMQRFNSLLTSAELEPTPLYGGPALCRPELCNKKCVRICPAGALSETDARSLSIGGKNITYAAHDNIRCEYAIVAMVKGSGGRSDVKIPEGPGKHENLAASYKKEMHRYDRRMIGNCFGLICGDFCGKCLHQCPSKRVAANELQDFDFSKRHSAVRKLI